MKVYFHIAEREFFIQKKYFFRYLFKIAVINTIKILQN